MNVSEQINPKAVTTPGVKVRCLYISVSAA